MFLPTVNEQFIRLLLDPLDKTLYGIVPMDQDPETLLSQPQLEQYFGVLFPCLGQGVAAQRVPQHRAHIAQTASVDTQRVPRHRAHRAQTASVDAQRVPQHRADIAQTASVDEEVCIICMEAFSDDNPRMCLPCQNQPQHVMRHCSYCRTCIQGLLEHSPGQVVICPICRRQFDVGELTAAYNENCLAYPTDAAPASMLTGWYTGDSDEKRRCLERMHVGQVPTQQQVQNQGASAHEAPYRMEDPSVVHQPQRVANAFLTQEPVSNRRTSRRDFYRTDEHDTNAFRWHGGSNQQMGPPHRVQNQRTSAREAPYRMEDPSVFRQPQRVANAFLTQEPVSNRRTSPRDFYRTDEHDTTAFRWYDEQMGPPLATSRWRIS